jgi:GTPase
MVLAINKWDSIKNKKEVLAELDYQVGKLLPEVKGVPVVPISALHGDKVYAVIDAALEAYEIWNKRFPTAQMNDWLKAAEQKHIPPLSHNKRRIRLKYITQGNRRPPTFTMFLNYPEDLPDSYKRYLINDMRSVFDLQGVPIRLMLRKSDNPYASRKTKKNT